MFKKTVKITSIVLLIIFLIVTITVTFFIINTMNQTKNVVFDKTKLKTETDMIEIYDNENNIIPISSNIVKPVVSLSELPEYVPDAFISIEDKRFFTHSGLDYKRIIKALYNNLKSRTIKEGASTISQQLIKNTHLSNEKTYERKIKEMILTKKLEKSFSKKDILEVYLNVIYFGEGCYGIESASNIFFNKPASQLTLNEASTLAGVIKSPSRYSPIYNKEESTKRRNIVLLQMYNNNKITKPLYYQTINETIETQQNESNYNINTLYLKNTIKEAKKILNLSEKDIASSGYKITTYLNSEAQKNLYKKVNDPNLYHKNQNNNIADSLAVIINNKSGVIEAINGKSKYDLLDFKRQPGSIIKPILVYAPALEQGLISPQTMILDEEINYGGYSPKNVGGYHDYVSITESISKSLNVPAVKVLDYVGIDNAKSFAKRAGINFDEKDNGYALALGGFTTGNNLLSLTNSFVPFANNGNYSNPAFIKEIKDKNDKVIYTHKKNEFKIMGEDTAYLMNSMLIDGVTNGTSKKLNSLKYEIAGKTGTVSVKNKNINTDAYSVAYTSEHTMGVWLGNYSNDPEYHLDSINNGGTYATQLIKNTFVDLYKNNTPAPFNVPNSIVERDIDNIALETTHNILLADDDFPDRYKKPALFSIRYLPSEISQTFTNLKVDNYSVEYNDKLNTSTIRFDANSFYKYQIIKVVNKKEYVLMEYSDKTESIFYVDSNLNFNQKYDYYIKISTNFNDNYSTSNKISIMTKSKNTDYNKILKNLSSIDKNKNTKQLHNNSDTWYF